MSTVVPLSTTLRTEILPPCASTIAFATARPTPFVCKSP